MRRWRGEIRERLGDPGWYQPYVPERWESEDGEGDKVKRIPNGLLVQSRVTPVVVAVDSHRSTSTYSCRASPSGELDTRKFTPPYTINNMAPVSRG